MYTKLICFIISLLIILVDFFSKKWIVTHISLGEIKTLLPFINFIHLQNSGIAFGLLAQKSILHYKIIFLIVVFIITKLFLIILNLDRKSIVINAAYHMIVSGAIGNLIDRIIYGSVIDFIDLHIYKFHPFVFNVADMSIFFGAAIIVIKSSSNFYN